MAAAPTYLELADGLAAEFTVVGDRVPSENEIASARGVSRPTARAALQELERRFLVRRVRGSGTYVSRRIDYVISDRVPPSASATLRAAGAEVRVVQVLTRSLACPADVAVHLGVERNTRVTQIRRVLEVDGLRTSSTSAYLLAAAVPGVASELATRSSLFEVLRDVYGIETRRRWTRASLELPPASVVDDLRLEGVPPTWLLEGVNERRSPPRDAIEFTRSWMRADVLNVMFEMGRPPEMVRRSEMAWKESVR